MIQKIKSVLQLCVIFCFIIGFSAPPAGALDLKGFGDITFGDESSDNGVSGFSLGQLDLWATQTIDSAKKMKVFMELVVESPGAGFVVDLERLWVEYKLLPQIRIRGGRFHTSLGYWNRSHHHGAHMQTSVFRPLFLDFEDGETAVLPSHMIGIMAVVKSHLANVGRFRLEMQAGNGASHNGEEIDPNNAGDIDEDKGVAVRLTFHPDLLQGLGVGFSFNYNPFAEHSVTKHSSLVNQTIFAADLTYLENNVEFIFEHYWILNKDKTNIAEKKRTSSFGYVQAGYTFVDMFTPYARFEFFDNLNPDDPYFIKVGTKEYHQTVVGVRYDLTINSSLKLEGRALKEVESSNSYWLQWTFAF